MYVKIYIVFFSGFFSIFFHFFFRIVRWLLEKSFTIFTSYEMKSVSGEWGRLQKSLFFY